MSLEASARPRAETVPWAKASARQSCALKKVIRTRPGDEILGYHLTLLEERSFSMKNLSVLCVALCVGLSVTAAFARGGGGGSHHSSTGGAFGTSPSAPGTNSLGTALSSSGTGSSQKGPQLGTSPAIDQEDAKVEKMIGSICRGC